MAGGLMRPFLPEPFRFQVSCQWQRTNSTMRQCHFKSIVKTLLFGNKVTVSNFARQGAQPHKILFLGAKTRQAHKSNAGRIKATDRIERAERSERKGYAHAAIILLSTKKCLATRVKRRVEKRGERERKRKMSFFFLSRR